jgi:hypothetical protein
MATINPENKPWILHMGCHRGTMMSRDCGNPEPMDSLGACRQAADRAVEWWRSFGYSVWFCYAVGPDKERIELHPSQHYR